MDKKYYGMSNYSSSISFGEEFCKVCIYYDKGDYKNAKSWMDYKVMPELQNISVYPILSKEQNDFVWKKVNAVDESYSSHKAEYDEEERNYEAERRAEEKKKAEEEAAKKQEAPYVGMPESKIDSTDLGKHSQYYKNFNTECISGEIYHASMYYWYSGSECIFSARCVQSRVYNVWDNRDRHITNNIVDQSSSSTKKKKKQESTTEFNPEDHDIEQYYEDYKDEFEDEDDAWDDFEDNEEYWDDY